MTWRDIAKAAGAKNDEQADALLWSGSAFPFNQNAREIYDQIRHVVRHRVCFDDPCAPCHLGEKHGKLHPAQGDEGRDDDRDEPRGGEG